MKYLKKFNESNFEGDLDVYLSMNLDFIYGNENYIKGYHIRNSDGTVDVNGNVSFYNKDLDKIPFKFGKVSGGYNCSSNNLTSLENCPNYVSDNFNCADNKLITLNGCPDVGGNLQCGGNNLYDFYDIGNVGGMIYCSMNPVYEIVKLCYTKEFINYLNEFRPIRGKTILGKRLEECLYMCDVTDVDMSKLKFKNYTLLE